MMHCRQCGKANSTGSTFCRRCGTAIHSRASAAAFDEEAWARVIGPKNTRFYLERFRAISDGDSRVRWHWPAFFVTWYWLLHRKMWGWSFLYLAAPLLATIMLGFVAAASGLEALAGPWANALVLVALYAGPPLVATRLYFKHCEQKMEKLRLSSDSRTGYLAALAARGGTSLIALLIPVALFVVSIGAAVGMPAYQQYTLRAKTNEATLYGGMVVQAVWNHHRATGNMPATVQELPGAGVRPASVGLVKIDPGTGDVTVQVVGLGHLTLAPKLKTGEFSPLTCSSRDIAAKLLPPHCR